jgi:uncharacterized protein
MNCSFADPETVGPVSFAAGCACFVAGTAFAYWLLRLKPPAGIASVREIIIYPIKSCGGVSVTNATVTRRGLENDRLFLITDKDGRMQTQRLLPAMARIRPSFNESGDLVMLVPGHIEFVIRKNSSDKGRVSTVSVWNSVCEAIDQGDEAAEILVNFLGKKGLRLVRMSDNFVRCVENGFVRQDDLHQVGFADQYSFLLSNYCSLELLREKSGIPSLHMHRFRPNIVLHGDSLHPFEEDGWSNVQIGRTKFEIAKMCSRCQVPRIDPWSGEMNPHNEPTNTLKTFRMFGSQIMFGQNAVALNFGEDITVGDRLVILSRKRPSKPLVPSRSRG